MLEHLSVQVQSEAGSSEADRKEAHPGGGQARGEHEDPPRVEPEHPLHQRRLGVLQLAAGHLGQSDAQGGDCTRQREYAVAREPNVEHGQRADGEVLELADQVVEQNVREHVRRGPLRDELHQENAVSREPAQANLLAESVLLGHAQEEQLRSGHDERIDGDENGTDVRPGRPQKVNERPGGLVDGTRDVPVALVLRDAHALVTDGDDEADVEAEVRGEDRGYPDQVAGQEQEAHAVREALRRSPLAGLRAAVEVVTDEGHRADARKDHDDGGVVVEKAVAVQQVGCPRLQRGRRLRIFGQADQGPGKVPHQKSVHDRWVGHQGAEIDRREVGSQLGHVQFQLGQLLGRAPGQLLHLLYPFRVHKDPLLLALILRTQVHGLRLSGRELPLEPRHLAVVVDVLLRLWIHRDLHGRAFGTDPRVYGLARVPSWSSGHVHSHLHLGLRVDPHVDLNQGTLVGLGQPGRGRGNDNNQDGDSAIWNPWRRSCTVERHFRGRYRTEKSVT
mmetsp:Transcript_30164/g.86161  ORF Transcript_30164/g.86161 Transcript_30164/m.86161 type:complete len:504 (+) Transcript_30164:662-2173(+)